MLALVAIGVATPAGVPGATVPTKPCIVPRVVGFGPYFAARLLAGKGCRFRVASRPRRRHVGLIAAAQSVSTGTSVPSGTRVGVSFVARPPRPKRCRLPRYAPLIASDGALIVWVAPSMERNPGGDGVEYEADQDFFACVRGQTGPQRVFTEIQTWAGRQELRGLHVAGDHVAFVDYVTTKYNTFFEFLHLYDASSGKLLFEREFDQYDEYEAGVEAQGLNRYALAFAVSEGGALAWIEGAGPHPDSRERLFIRDGAGVRVVESGAGMTDLEFAGETLRWSAGGAQHTLASD